MLLKRYLPIDSNEKVDKILHDVKLNKGNELKIKDIYVNIVVNISNINVLTYFENEFNKIKIDLHRKQKQYPVENKLVNSSKPKSNLKNKRVANSLNTQQKRVKRVNKNLKENRILLLKRIFVNSSHSINEIETQYRTESILYEIVKSQYPDFSSNMSLTNCIVENLHEQLFEYYERYIYHTPPISKHPNSLNFGKLISTAMGNKR